MFGTFCGMVHTHTNKVYIALVIFATRSSAGLNVTAAFTFGRQDAKHDRFGHV